MGSGRGVVIEWGIERGREHALGCGASILRRACPARLRCRAARGRQPRHRIRNLLRRGEDDWLRPLRFCGCRSENLRQHPLQQNFQTPSLPDARPRSDRFRCGGRRNPGPIKSTPMAAIVTAGRMRWQDAAPHEPRVQPGTPRQSPRHTSTNRKQPRKCSARRACHHSGTRR